MRQILQIVAILCAFGTVAEGHPASRNCNVKVTITPGTHTLTIPMTYWELRRSRGGPGNFVLNCGQSTELGVVTVAAIWPNFTSGANLTKHGRINGPTWHGFIDATITDENAMPPIPPQPPGLPAIRPLDWYYAAFDKPDDTSRIIEVRRGLDGVEGFTTCFGNVGCADYVNHAGLRIEISFAPALSANRAAIETGVFRLLDKWSN